MAAIKEMGVRRFGRVNWLGLGTLARREVRRFLSVWTQTVLAPMITAGLFMAVFALAVGPSRGEMMGAPFILFLAPGILMMTVIQNAFANTSSSIMIAKSQGNIVDTLMPPLSPMELLAGYMAGAVGRGIFVAAALLAAMVPTIGSSVEHPLWLLAFVVLGSALMGGLGIVAAVFATKFDHMAAITNFVVAPLSFLSGTFYSIKTLSVPMQTISRLNPVFYLIDGARYGMIGTSDSSPWIGLAIAAGATAAVLTLCWRWFAIGYRLKA